MRVKAGGTTDVFIGDANSNLSTGIWTYVSGVYDGTNMTFTPMGIRQEVRLTLLAERFLKTTLLI